MLVSVGRCWQSFGNAGADLGGVWAKLAGDSRSPTRGQRQIWSNSSKVRPNRGPKLTVGLPELGQHHPAIAEVAQNWPKTPQNWRISPPTWPSSPKLGRNRPNVTAKWANVTSNWSMSPRGEAPSHFRHRIRAIHHHLLKQPSILGISGVLFSSVPASEVRCSNAGVSRCGDTGGGGRAATAIGGLVQQRRRNPRERPAGDRSPNPCEA